MKLTNKTDKQFIKDFIIYKQQTSFVDIQRDYAFWRSIKILNNLHWKNVTTQDKLLKNDLISHLTFTHLYASLMSWGCNR